MVLASIYHKKKLPNTLIIRGCSTQLLRVKDRYFFLLFFKGSSEKFLDQDYLKYIAQVIASEGRK